MLQLPIRLEKKLKTLIPRARDRETFVVEAVERAMQSLKEDDTPLPSAVGGTLHLFADGGSRGNPGEAAVGCVLLDPESGNVLKTSKEAIGIHTNNEAEYKALIRGLETARDFRPNHLVVHLDSELIVKQMTGEYRVKMPSLQTLMDEAQDIARDFPDVSFCHVPRAQNAHADRLVNEALNAIGA